MVDWEKLEAQLAGEGLGGWVHGGRSDEQLLVFTWRHPESFFINVQVPMIAATPELAEKLAQLRRHDYVVIRGNVVQNKAPIRHLLITELVELKKWEGPGSDIDFEYQQGLRAELLAQDFATFKIHAIANEGRVLVVEYKDLIVPVVNPQPERAASLYRNDIVYIKYQARALPMQPLHLQIDYQRPDPILLIEPIVSGHGEAFTLTGPLVMFPQSPQIIFDVFAIRSEDVNQLQHNYTLVNFTDPEIFLQLRDQLAEIWQQNAAGATYDRNKFINRNIIVTAKGTKNVISPNQANPQIVIEKLEDVSVTIQSESAN